MDLLKCIASRVRQSNGHYVSVNYVSTLASEDAQQQENHDDGKNEADPATAVVTPAGTDSISAVTKTKDQNDQQNDQKHNFLLCNLDSNFQTAEIYELPQNMSFSEGTSISLNLLRISKPLRSNLRVEMRAFVSAMYRDSVTG